MAKGKPWTRPELMLTVELYCGTPFGRIHSKNSDIIALSRALDRAPGSVAMKMVNFAALDETIAQKGMSNVSVADREIWSEFFSAPAAFLERVDNIKQREFSIPDHVELSELREGADFEYIAKGRRNQDFFRRAVLAAYEGRCAVTGITQPELLVASHIVAWADDVDLRVRPTNGICLNALHDRAFDKHLISFEDDLSMIVSQRLKMTAENRPFFQNLSLQLPSRFRPDVSCLARHRDRLLEKDRA